MKRRATKKKREPAGKAAKNGRPTKFDQEIAEKILQELREGSFRTTAALAAGITARTFFNWLLEGRENPGSKMGGFFIQVSETEARAENVLAKVAYRAGQVDPDFALRYLRIRHSKRWSERQRMEVTGKNGGPQKHEVSLAGYTDDELEQLEAIHRAANARRGEDRAGQT